MKAKIQDRFDLNISRVKNLVTIYGTIKGAGKGRRGHSKTDVLRAATVLLHATVEDVLRSLAYWKLPLATPAVLEGYPLPGAGASTKFHLGQLAAHRGKTVDAVITESVNAYLERSNYNNTSEVAKLLTDIGVPLASLTPTFTELENLMKRRHQIVHRADKNEAGGKGHHKVTSISPAQVNIWIDTVETFVTATMLLA